MDSTAEEELPMTTGQMALPEPRFVSHGVVADGSGGGGYVAYQSEAMIDHV